MEAHTLFQFNATSDEELSFPAGVIIKVDAVNCFASLYRALNAVLRFLRGT